MRKLDAIPAFGKEEKLQAVIETPKGSHNKFAYDSGLGCFKLKKVLPEGMTFPFDFGFIPSTGAQDGDPVDVLVLMDFPVVPGCLLSVRVIGVIKAEQREEKGGWVRNDRLIAVAEEAHTQKDIRSLADLRGGRVDEIAAFFAQYDKLLGVRFRRIGTGDAKAAMTLIKKAMRRPAKR